MAEKIFPEGIRAFKKNDKAPDYVLASVVISINELNNWLRGDGGQHLTQYNKQEQLKLQLLNSKDGKPYFTVDTFKPNKEQQAQSSIDELTPEQPSDDLPF